MKSIFLLTFLLLCGCAKDPISSNRTQNKDFIVEFLFEYEGIRVYRFYDNGRYHWFTSKGEIMHKIMVDKCNYDETI